MVNTRKGRPITEKASQKMKQVAEMNASGMSQTEISRELSVPQSTVSVWLHRPEVMELRNEHLKSMIQTMVSKAYAVLSMQLEDDNPWIRQGAAREIIRIAERQAEVDEHTIEVEFVNMQAPGTPKSAEDDKEASAIEVEEISDLVE